MVGQKESDAGLFISSTAALLDSVGWLYPFNGRLQFLSDGLTIQLHVPGSNNRLISLPHSAGTLVVEAVVLVNVSPLLLS